MNPIHLFGGGGSQGVEVFTWGRNDGKVKLGRQVKKSSKKKPKSIKVLNGTRPLFVEAGEFHSFVIANEGRDVYGWGRGNKGQLGRGDTNEQSIPRLISGLRDRRIIKLACGTEHSLAISSDGFLYSFGSNSKGQLGTGSSNQFSCIPEVVKGKWGDQRIVNISCGNVISIAITEEGELYEWGDVSSGLLGNGSEPHDFYNPVKSVHFIGVSISSVCFGACHWIALTRDGFVYAFGDNKTGQLGITSGNRVMDQAELVTSLKGVVQIATGHHHSVALCENGELYCFGDNSEGQLGMGDKKTRYVPTKVRFPPSFLCDNLVSVAAGAQHTICLTKSGRTFGWGNNHKHQISAGLKREISEPCLISGLRHQLVKQVSAGGNSSIAMTGRMTGKGGGDPTQQQHIHFGYHAITIAVGTFNINGQKVSLSKNIIREWLLGYNQPDIIVVGITELVKLSGREVAKDLVEIESNAMRIYFESQFEETLNEKHHLLPEDEEEDYVQLFSKSLVGTMLCIYTKKKIREQITDLAWDQARVGIMGKMANKGAVSARFSLHESQLCFVASHLAAGQSKVEKRNLDYTTICSKLRFSVKNSELTIFDHENIFWCGDLNYRLTGITKEDAINTIKKGALEDLWAHDQLLIETQAKRIFLDFNEGKLNFAPTYKYDLNSNIYDTSEKQRVPSWCDRILWRGDFLMQLDYSRHEIFTSDHCPVSGLFRVIITKVEKEGEGQDSGSEEDEKPLAPRMDPNEKRTQILLQSEHISSLSSGSGSGDTEKEILRIRNSTEKSGEFPKFSATSIVVEKRFSGVPNSLLRDSFEKDMEKRQRRARPHSTHLPGSNYREISDPSWKSYNEACDDAGIDNKSIVRSTVIGDTLPPLYVPLDEIQTNVIEETSSKSSNPASNTTSPLSLSSESAESDSKSVELPFVSYGEMSQSVSPPKPNFSVRRFLRESSGAPNGSDKKSPPEKHYRGSLPSASYRMEAKSLPSSPRVSPRFRSPNQINAEVITPYKSKEGIVFAAGEEVKIMGSETIEGQDWVKVETKSLEQGMIPRLRVKILESKEGQSTTTSSDSQESIKLSSVTVSIDDPWIVKQGYLVKRGSIRKNWKSRFFVLTPANLSYYHSQHSGKIPLGVINIWEDRIAIKFERSVVIDKSGTPKNIFIIKGTHRKDLHIDAGTSIEMEAWITALESVVNGDHRHILLGKFPRKQET